MFENIIEQEAASQLREDINSGRNAPSMLFYGPSESAKGSAALEFARVMSCETNGTWKCSCPSCERHRYLQHDDLLMLGKRSFAREITACCHVFLRNPSSLNAKLLFFRSLRKLQIRFSPVLTEDDPKFGKYQTVLQSFDENLNELFSLKTENSRIVSFEKLCNSLLKDALFLEDEGISGIPVNHIRKAAYWCRLAPEGIRKTLVIENAQDMRDEARNSLLKLLEEPPSLVNIILTSQRREAVIPTILSRLRPYRFLKRSEDGEREVLRRVFQITDESELRRNEGSLISSFLASFLPGSAEKLYPIAVLFIVSVTRITALSVKKKKGSIPVFLSLLGERYAQEAESLKLERILKSADLVKTVLSQSGGFENDSFLKFLKICLDLIAPASVTTDNPHYIAYNEIFRKNIAEAAAAVDVLNLSAALALESLVYKLKTDMIKAA